jgi:carbonic anhydrase/acetyltransferase-like protein (isoleucine patch superfamily)
MKKIFSLLLVFTFSFLIFPVKEAAAEVIIKERGMVSVRGEEVVDDDLFVGAETVEILGTVNGDVYVGTGSLRVDGVINGNLHAGSGMTTISGVISGSVYVGSGNLIVENAKIGNSLLVGAGNVSIDKDSEIGGSFLVGSGSVAVNSPIGRNVFVGAGTVDLNSSVGGEARVAGGIITLGPDANIAKDFTYAINEQEGSLNISDTASVSGSINRSEYKFATEEEVEMARSGFSKVFRAVRGVTQLISLVGALIVGLLALRFFNKFFTKATSHVEKSFWKSLGVGFLVIIAAIPTFVLLAITGVGLSLVWVLFLLLMLGIYFSKIVVALCLGNWLVDKLGKRKISVYAVFAIGLLALYILKFIPVIGFFTSVVVLFSGLGALTLHLKSTATLKK